MREPEVSDIAQVICVLGFPRSGTSWFANLLNSHPNTLYRHEVIGRLYKNFGDELFSKMKFDHGLSDLDRRRALEIIVRADVQSDKPPFFKKRYRAISAPKLQKVAWLFARGSMRAAHLYSTLYTPTNTREINLVLKETRSAVNLDSIIKGIRADALIVLIRHPYRVVGSHLRGIKMGNMRESTQEDRVRWIQEHGASSYVRTMGLRADDVRAMSEAEFVALAWRIQNEEYLKIGRQHGVTRSVLFDEFLKDVESNTVRMLSWVNLSCHEQVTQFIRESTGLRRKREIVRDASSEYFSVYRNSAGKQESHDEFPRPKDRELIDLHTKGFLELLSMDGCFVK